MDELVYPLKTARLLLRPYAESDYEALYEIQSRSDVTRFLYWGPRDRTEVRESLEMKLRATRLDDEGDNLTLAVVLPETGALAGDVQLIWTSRDHFQGEIGYVLHPDHTGRGYATEAADVMLRIGFERLGLHRICGRLDGRNAASAGVLERLGMRREAHFRENEFVKSEWTDELVYAILEDEWRARRDAITGR
ncbi:MAG TPA: GNAT family protein [Streptosporangiaceae bacterium]